MTGTFKVIDPKLKAYVSLTFAVQNTQCNTAKVFRLKLRSSTEPLLSSYD
jgi:hypothetical protein